jgi:hypothetical protein
MRGTDETLVAVQNSRDADRQFVTSIGIPARCIKPDNLKWPRFVSFSGNK